MDFHHPSSREFANYCDRRAAMIARQAPKGESLRFDIYDFARGTQTTRRIEWTSGQRRETIEPVQISQAVNPKRDMIANQTKEGVVYSLKDGMTTVMSILQIYSAVRQIGLEQPGSLHEFSIFSHAYWQGPILLNSTNDRFIRVPGIGGRPAQLQPIEVGKRDPDDKDCRVEYDFRGPTNDTHDLALFRSAFAPDGHLWVWGCSFPERDNVLFSLIRKAIGGRATLEDNTELVLKLQTPEHFAAVLELNDILRTNRDTLFKTRKLEVTFGQARALVWEKLTSTYPYAAAAALRVPVIGAAYGTFAEPIKPETKESLMRVSGVTGANVSFYKRHFGMRTDLEGRNYFIFTHDMKPN